MVEIASTWPQLRVLEWRENWDDIDAGVAPLVTLHGLEAFAVRSPYLEELEISVDARPRIARDGTHALSHLKPLLSVTIVDLCLSLAGSSNHAIHMACTVEEVWTNVDAGSVG